MNYYQMNNLISWLINKSINKLVNEWQNEYIKVTLN